MTSYDNFIRVLDEIYQAHFDTLRLLPSALLDGWISFVEQCEEGYRFCLSEYDHDILIRREIEFLLSFSALRTFSEFQYFVDQIQETDNRFRALLLPDIIKPYSSSDWWARGVLKYAQREYATDLKNLYGIDVAEVKDALE